MRLKLLNGSLIWLFLWPFPICAQEVTLTATVNQNEIGLNDQFLYSVEVSGKSTNFPDIEFPDFSDFNVLSGPNTSTSIQWINGAMTSSKTYSFYLQPRQEGQFIIGKAMMEVKGLKYYSDEIRMTVKKSSASNQPSRQQAQSRSDADISGENLYLKAEVDKSTAYLGQQIVLTYKLYFRVNVRGYNIDKLPANAGFWSEDFKMPNQPIIENEVINGINYNVATLRKVALFPTQLGNLSIEPMQVTLEALVKSRRQRNLFDSFFDDPFGQTIQKTITSKPITTRILPLPQEGKPADFNGAVGSYKFKVTTDKTKAAINEAISLKLELYGSGNIKLIDIPKPKIPSDIEQYEPKITTDINNEGNSIAGAKNAEYILIPRIEGQYQIKPIAFSYFDPFARKYFTVNSSAIDLNIERGSGSSITLVPQTSGFSRQEVKLLGQDIRFIKEFSDFHRIGVRPYLAVKSWVGILSALVLFIGFIAYNNYQVKLHRNEKLARSRKAGKYAAKQLMEAKKKLTAENQTEFYKAISQALQVFLRDKLNIDLSDFSVVKARNVLEIRNIDQQEINDYIAVLEESDFRQFANFKATLEERKEIYAKAKDILTRFDKWI